MSKQVDILNDQDLASYIALVDLETRSNNPTAPVYAQVEHKGFDLETHLITRILADKDKKSAAQRHILSVIRTYLNKGKTAEDIAAAYKNDARFLAILGKHFDRNLDKYVQKSREWDEHKNQVEVFYNLLCHVYQAANSKKVQKDTKKYAPLLLLVPALTTALSINRTAITAQHYMRDVGSILALSDAGLEGNNQQRKWKAYEKQGYITFTPGKKGGDSNRVEILPYAGPELSIEQKLQALTIILGHVQHQGMKDKLANVLTDIANSEDSPRYGNCDLQNKVDDLLAEFAPIAGQVVETRKAERLVESVEFAEAIKDEAEEMSARVTAMLQAGVTLVQEAAVEAPESVCEPLTIQEPAELDLNAIFDEIWAEEYAAKEVDRKTYAGLRGMR